MITSESHKVTKSKAQIDHFASETLIRVSLILRARTWPGGLTQPRPGISRLSSSSFARPMQAPGKIARQPMLVASCGPPRDLSDGKGDKGGGTHGIQKVEPRKGDPTKHDPVSITVVAVAGTAESLGQTLMDAKFSAPQVRDILLALWLGRSRKFRINCWGVEGS